jgi:hypothetical protein
LDFLLKPPLNLARAAVVTDKAGVLFRKKEEEQT